MRNSRLARESSYALLVNIRYAAIIPLDSDRLRHRTIQPFNSCSFRRKRANVGLDKSDPN